MVLLFCLGLPGLLRAGGQTSGSLTLSSTYLWRGLDANHRNPSLYGEVYYHGSSGFHIGATAAHVDFQGGPTTDPRMEFQIDAGYSWERHGIHWKAGIFTIQYPRATSLSFEEPYLSLEKGHGRLVFAYAPHFFGSDSASVFEKAGYNLPLGHRYAFDLEFGHMDFSDPVAAGLADYNYLQGALEKDLGEYSARLVYSHTEPGSVGFPVARWVVSLSHSF